MKLKSFQTQYELCEFHHYINHVDGKSISVVEVLIDCPIDNFREEDFESIFIIEDEKQTYVFSWYKVNEFYEENGLLRVVCVK